MGDHEPRREATRPAQYRHAHSGIPAHAVDVSTRSHIPLVSGPESFQDIPQTVPVPGDHVRNNHQRDIRGFLFLLTISLSFHDHSDIFQPPPPDSYRLSPHNKGAPHEIPGHRRRTYHHRRSCNRTEGILRRGDHKYQGIVLVYVLSSCHGPLQPYGTPFGKDIFRETACPFLLYPVLRHILDVVDQKPDHRLV